MSAQLITLLNDKTQLLSVGALMIISAVHLKNSYEQLGIGNSMLGMALFVIGWVIVGYSVGSGPLNEFQFSAKLIISLLCAAGIVLSVMQIKGGAGGAIFPIIFAGSWIVLGILSGLDKPLINKIFGLAAPAFVLLSMMLVLPWARNNNVVDNPGFSLFFMGWISLIFANAYLE